MNKRVRLGTNCVTEVAQKVVRPTQTTFMPWRHILEGVVVLHETMHELHRNKMNGILLKKFLEKAYDKVNWIFFATSVVYERF
jgi:hypothetical protein